MFPQRPRVAAAMHFGDDFPGYFAAGSDDPVESVAGMLLYLLNNFIGSDPFRPEEYGPEDTLIS